jgi:aspartate racemase
VADLASATKTVGVIGGMGPAATASFFKQLVDATHADSDQEHLHVLIDCDPAIPDRTLALVGAGPSPVPHLRRIAARLEAMGAELLVIPCNGAHAFAAEVASSVGVPLVSWIAETVTHLISLEPRPRRVGLLATTGTLASGVYQAALANAGLEAILPSVDEQSAVMASVYGLKAGNTDQPLVQEVLARLVERGADVVVLACTELPDLHLRDDRVPVIDPATVLAARVVELAGGSLRKASAA